MEKTLLEKRDRPKEFFAELFSIGHGEYQQENKTLPALILKLNKESNVDFCQLAVAAINDNFRCFDAIHIFEDTLSDMNLNLDSVLRLAESMFEGMQNDMAAHIQFKPFEDLTIKQPEFARNLLTELLKQDIQSDNFDDLVELGEAENIDKKKLFELSTLFPILAQWSLALGMDDIYSMIQKLVAKDFSDCTLQIWYPDKETDALLYKTNAANESGNSEAPLSLETSIDEMKNRIKLVQGKTISFEEISSVKAGLPYLPILASRHFRTPMLPFYWQSNLIKKSQSLEYSEETST